ncbi:hypothetical protein BGU82_20010, partial [Clostridioides difficile]|uniref:hypothetical protein n=1 Tax=Clostridioides difficile TaxID=1496 RepID=UPI000BC6472D
HIDDAQTGEKAYESIDYIFFFKAEDGKRVSVASGGLGEGNKRRKGNMYLGKNAYGAAKGAEVYFGKKVVN